MSHPNLPPELPIRRPTVPQPVPDVSDEPGDDAALPNPTDIILTSRYIRGGSWLLSYEPVNTWVRYDGTFRVENRLGGQGVGIGRTASGDLYRRPNTWITLPGIGTFPVNMPPPNPVNGIPILGRTKYTYYLRVTKIDEFVSFDNDFELEVQLYRYNQTAPNNFTFALEDTMAGTMKWKAAPAGYPSPIDYIEGDLNSAKTGGYAGRLKMGWLSSRYRKAAVEIDTVNDAPVPLANSGTPTLENWATVFNRVGFQMNQVTSQRNIPDQQAGGDWNVGELHNAMLANRVASTNLDTEWRYYQLVVNLITGGSLGIMFDTKIAGATADPNNTPREGCAVSCKTRLPDTPVYGSNAGKQFGQAPSPFFRSSIHELGHAMGLQHTWTAGDRTFMAQTGFIASQSSATAPFDTQIVWDFNKADLKRLRHWPDIFVRPGGVEFTMGTDTNPPITPDDSPVNSYPGLTLTLTPLEPDMPLGAPVRVELKITNQSKDATVSIPSNFGLSSSFTSGTVTDSAGTVRRFRPFVIYDQIEHLTALHPGQDAKAHLTLFSGPDGPLFQSTGLNTVTANIVWDMSGGSDRQAIMALSASSTVLVISPTTSAHAKAAHRVLTAPDAQTVLVVGGDHLKDGIAAIQEALRDKTLGRHWAVIEARRVATKFMGRPADAAKAAQCVSACDGGAIASKAETEKLAKMGVVIKVAGH